MTGGGEGLTETSRVGVDAFSGRSVVSGQEFRLSVNHNRVIQLCILNTSLIIHLFITVCHSVHILTIKTALNRKVIKSRPAQNPDNI